MGKFAYIRQDKLRCTYILLSKLTYNETLRAKITVNFVGTIGRFVSLIRSTVSSITSKSMRKLPVILIHSYCSPRRKDSE